MNLLLVASITRPRPWSCGRSWPASSRTWARPTGLKDCPEIAEIILYGTCNRVELLCVAEEPEPAAARLAPFFPAPRRSPRGPGGLHLCAPGPRSGAAPLPGGRQPGLHGLGGAPDPGPDQGGLPPGHRASSHRAHLEPPAAQDLLGGQTGPHRNGHRRPRRQRQLRRHQPGPEDLRRAHRHDGAPGGGR